MSKESHRWINPETLAEIPHERRQKLRGGVIEALENGPAEGLSGPQIHSTAPGNYVEIRAAIFDLLEDDVVLVTNLTVDDEMLYGYMLNSRCAR